METVWEFTRDALKKGCDNEALDRVTVYPGPDMPSPKEVRAFVPPPPEAATGHADGPGGRFAVETDHLAEVNAALTRLLAGIGAKADKATASQAEQPAAPGVSAPVSPADARQEKAEEHEATPAATPSPLLFGWREILSALGRPNDDRRRVSRLNKKHNGPIIMPRAGGQPTVDRNKLIAWWNSLEKEWKEKGKREADAQATVAAQYGYGRSEEIVPNISGHVKHRRKDRKP
jgi:hypothetical protein